MASSEVATRSKAIVGMECSHNNLYQKWDTHNHFTWTET